MYWAFNMKNLKHILFFFLVSHVYFGGTFAQSKQTDSLYLIINSNVETREKIKAYTALTNIQSTKNFDECLELVNDGRKLAARFKDSAALAYFDNIAGVAYYFKGSYDSAAVLYQRSLAKTRATGDLKALAGLLNDIGRLYRKTKDLDRSLSYYDEALNIYRNLKNEDGIATILNESGVVFEYKGDYPEAISRYKESLAIREKMNDSLGISYSYSFLGGVYNLQKDFDNAKKHHEYALEIRKKLKDSFAIVLTLSDMGVMYKDMGQFDQSIDYFSLSNAFAEAMRYPQLLLENYRTMAELEEKRDRPGQALMYMKRFGALKDSLFNAEKVKQIEELNTKYETEKKEQQLQLQEAQLSRKNILIFGISLGGLLLIIAGLSIYRRKQVQNKLALQETINIEQEKAARAVIEAEENERKRIAAELHDGVGQMMSAAKMNLSVFESELPFADDAQKKSFENVINLVDLSCKEVRSVSHQMMPNALLKKGLADAIREFIDRIDHRVIQVSLHAEGLREKLDANTETVLYRVIQECVNNVLKHAQASRLDISLIKDTDGISVTIEDNGKGFDASKIKDAEGIGVKNIRSRVQFLKGTVEFDSSPGQGTLVAIHIPGA